MLRVARGLLLRVVDDIDAGNSELSEEDALAVVDILRKYTFKDELFSKCQACQYLHMGRPTFDLYVRSGFLPKGKKRAGFKELSWTKRELDDYLRKTRNI